MKTSWLSCNIKSRNTDPAAGTSWWRPNQNNSFEFFLMSQRHCGSLLVVKNHVKLLYSKAHFDLSFSLSVSVGFCSYRYQSLPPVLSSQPARRSETGSHTGLCRLRERDRKGRTSDWYPSNFSHTGRCSLTVYGLRCSRLTGHFKNLFSKIIPRSPSTQMLKKSLISTSVGTINIFVICHALVMCPWFSRSYCHMLQCETSTEITFTFAKTHTSQSALSLSVLYFWSYQRNKNDRAVWFYCVWPFVQAYDPDRK